MNPELKRIVNGFVKGLIGKNSSKDLCWITSLPLASYLNMCGFDVYLIKGKVGHCHHWWLETANEEVIDCTADQFKQPDGSSMPRIYFGKRPEWYKPLKNR